MATNSQLNKIIGNRISVFRRESNISQIELAKRLGMAGAQLNKIESGQNLPSVRTLNRIESALGLTPDTLVEVRASLLRGESIPEGASRQQTDISPIRATPKIPDSLSEQLLDDIAPILQRYVDLQNSLHVLSFIPSTFFQQIASSHLTDAEILAHVIRSSLDGGIAPASSLVPLLEANNIRIIFTGLLNSSMHAKSFFDNRFQNLIVCVSEESSPERQLNDIVKELAYACMFLSHQRIPVEDTSSNYNYAQTFAQAFFIPRASIRQIMMQLNATASSWNLELLCQLKVRYGVSAELLLHRLHALNLIDYNIFSKIRSQIKQHYAEIESQFPVGSPEYRAAIEPKTRAPELPRNTWLNTLSAASARPILSDTPTSSQSPVIQNESLPHTPAPADAGTRE